jgi:hypothetical protein
MVERDSIDAGWLMTSYARHLGGDSADYEGAKELLARARNVARQVGDRQLELRALAVWVNLAPGGLCIDDLREKTAEALRLSEEVDSPRDKAFAHGGALVLSLLDGDVDGARVHARAHMKAAERMRDREGLSTTYMMSQVLAQVVGEWSEAREWSEKALRFWPGDFRALAARVQLESDVGAVERVDMYLERMAELATVPGLEGTQSDLYMADVIARVGWDLGDTRRFDTARCIARRVLAAPRARLWAMRARTTLALMDVVEGHVEAAREQYPVLQARCRPFPLWQLTWATGRLLGLVARGADMLEEAATHFEDALTFCREAGYLPQLAWTCCDFADLLLEREEPGDREKATSLLDEGLAISRDLGMRPLMERILSRQEILRA